MRTTGVLLGERVLGVSVSKVFLAILLHFSVAVSTSLLG